MNTMRTLRTSPMTDWMQEVDQLFRPFTPTFKNTFDRNGEEKAQFSPAVDVKETEKEYFFFLDLPGLNDKDLNVSVIGRELQVSGERRQEKSPEGSRSHRIERRFGKFERTFLLPEEVNAEKIEAQFKDGVLEIRVPKVEAAQPKTIQIRTQ